MIFGRRFRLVIEFKKIYIMLFSVKNYLIYYYLIFFKNNYGNKFFRKLFVCILRKDVSFQQEV